MARKQQINYLALIPALLYEALKDRNFMWPFWKYPERQASNYICCKPVANLVLHPFELAHPLSLSLFLPPLTVASLELYLQ